MTPHSPYLDMVVGLADTVIQGVAEETPPRNDVGDSAEWLQELCRVTNLVVAVRGMVEQAAASLLSQLARGVVVGPFLDQKKVLLERLDSSVARSEEIVRQMHAARYDHEEWRQLGREFALLAVALAAYRSPLRQAMLTMQLPRPNRRAGSL